MCLGDNSTKLIKKRKCLQNIKKTTISQLPLQFKVIMWLQVVPAEGGESVQEDWVRG